MKIFQYFSRVADQDFRINKSMIFMNMVILYDVAAGAVWKGTCRVCPKRREFFRRPPITNSVVCSVQS